MTHDTALREHLVQLLTGSDAHASFESAVKAMPAALAGSRPPGVDHSPWELLEHLRIAQWDILEFSRDPRHQSPVWPGGYWPQSPAPPDAHAWGASVRAFLADREELCALIIDPATDLYARIPHGDGQTILREALVTADHNAYHAGQLIALRKLLGAWQ